VRSKLGCGAPAIRMEGIDTVYASNDLGDEVGHGEFDVQLYYVGDWVELDVAVRYNVSPLPEGRGE